jgi:hypothetical protein
MRYERVSVVNEVRPSRVIRHVLSAGRLAVTYGSSVVNAVLSCTTSKLPFPYIEGMEMVPKPWEGKSLGGGA